MPTHHPCRKSLLLSMTKRSFSSLTIATFIIITATILFTFIPPTTHAFGSDSTLAVISAFGLEILAGWKISQRWWQRLRQPIISYHRRQTVAVKPNISFFTIFGGRTFAGIWRKKRFQIMTSDVNLTSCRLVSSSAHFGLAYKLAWAGANWLGAGLMGWVGANWLSASLMAPGGLAFREYPKKRNPSFHIRG